MTITNQRFSGLGKGLLALALAGAPGLLAQDDDEEVFELSPFSVTASDDRGYEATSTLAGTRLKSQVKDLAGALQIVTEEFLEDFATTGTEDLFLYTTSTETGGPSGNFGGSEGREDPDSNNRIRGLAGADRTRGYFLSDIALDTYNTDRVTINRGPNSLLFGLGSPGGIVNNNLKQAVFKDMNKISLRYGSWGSHREILDVNRELVEDKLAIRLVGLNNATKYKMKPSFQDEQRLYAAITAKILENTTLRANMEIGSRDASRPYGNAPSSNIPNWVDEGMQLKATPYSGVAGFGNIGGNRSPGFTFDSPTATETSAGFEAFPAVNGPDGQKRYHFTWANRDEEAGALLSNGVLTDDQSWVFDFRNRSVTGLDNTQYKSFDAKNIALEQTFLENKAGIEIAFDEQYSKNGYLNRTQNRVNVDVSEVMPYFLEVEADGTPIDVPNPNVGRPYVDMYEKSSHTMSTREAVRATAFYDLDFASQSDNLGWLGHHVFTGMFSSQSRLVETRGAQYGSKVDGIGEAILEANKNGQNFTSTSWDLMMRGKRYVGDPITGRDAPAAVGVQARTPRINQFTSVFYNSLSDDPLFAGHNGAYEQVTTPVHVDPITSASLGEMKIDSLALTAQSYLFNDNLVLTYGWREDEASSYDDFAADATVDGIALPETLALPSTPDDIDKGSIFSWGAVAHLPRDLEERLGIDLSVHYGVSENYVPSPGRITIMNEKHPSPAGDTVEMGFSVGLWENKFRLRVNQFETNSANQKDHSLGAASFPNWERLYYNNVRNQLQDKEPRDATVPPEVYETWASDDPRLWPNNIKWADTYTLPPQGMMDAFWTPNNPDPSPGGTPSVTDRGNSNVTGVSDFKTKGYEFEGSFNPTENWTFTFNAAKMKVIKTNVLKSYQEYLDIRIPQWKAMENLIPRAGTYKNDNPQTVWERSQVIHMKPIIAQQSKEGALSDEVREWRFNLMGRYSFKEGVLKGTSFGGAYRWQDEAAIGFPDKIVDGITLTDVDNPFFGESESNVDFFVTHSRKIMEDKVNWRLQLNVLNALDEDELIVRRRDSDGIITSVRVPNPINYRLTSSFDF